MRSVKKLIEQAWTSIFLTKDNTIVWGGFLLFALAVFTFIIVEKNSIAERRMRVSKTSQEIEEIFSSRMASDGNVLHTTKAFIAQSGADVAKFRKYVEDLEIFKNYPGMQGLGYIRFDGPVSESMHCRVQVVHPRTWEINHLFGTDVCADKNFRQAVLNAVTTNTFTTTLPRDLKPGSKHEKFTGFFVFLPLYESSAQQESPDKALGVVFAPINVYELFRSFSGTPLPGNERYNYRIDLIAAGVPHTLYKRFPEESLSIFEAQQKNFTLFGQNFLLTVEPFNNYFQFKDLYLSYFVGLVLLLISILILWLIRGNSYQLSLERKTNDILTSLYRETHEKVESLRKINEISRILNRDLLLDNIIKNLVRELDKLHPFDDIVVYLKDGKESQDLNLSEHSKHRHIKYKNSLPSLALESQGAFADKLNTQGGECRDLSFDIFFSEPVAKKRVSDQFCQILMLNRDVYVVLMLFKKGGFFAVKDHEMLANICSQTALIVKNSFLLKRVEDSNEAKNAFLANMSHEIRTPLNAIIGFSEMIFQDDLKVDHKNELKNLINKNGEHLVRIIDDILDLSKVEAGKVVVDKKKVSLVTLLHEVSSVVSLRMERKNLTFNIENAGSVPATIFTDNIRLKQILLNLIGNSIKFTEMGGITLTVGCRHNKAGEDVIFFRTKDTGIGISADQQQKLFEVFSQGDASKTRKYGGAGLGLALSKKLAQELGGDLELLESRRGEGSTFEVYVKVGTPVTEWIDVLATQTLAAEAPKPVLERLDGLKILLVEDSPDNQDIFNYFLRKYGADVTTVADGLKAVSEANDKDFDMILMDIQIPEIDGKEATRRIRKNGYQKPIVAVTAHAMSDEIKSCIEAGCVGQISKPVVENDFISQVNFYLKGP